MMTATAVHSEGRDTALPYQVLHPIANDSARSTKNSDCRTNAPDTGAKADSSARHMVTDMTKTPTAEYPIRVPAGPARRMDLPEPKNRPVPIAPAKAIIWGVSHER